MEEEGDILIFDIGGRRNGTITIRVWHVFECTNNKQILLGYQYKSERKMYPIVYAVTKVWIQGIYLPVLLMINYATLLDDPDETEYSYVTFDMMKHGAKFGMTTRNLVRDGVLYVNGEYLTFLVG